MSDVKAFGAVGDGETDDTAAIQHAVDDGDGLVQFSRGRYRITRPIVLDLDRQGPLAIDGVGGVATVEMAGPGPAFRLIGTHGGTARPRSVKAAVWQRQRRPTVRDIEVVGAHAEADGIALAGTMQATLDGVAVRRCRHGIVLQERNRNVVIRDCHVYENTGIGVFLDGVNLHQINIVGCHVSYCRLGGIRIERSEVRNLQITGNDIEYNNAREHEGLATEPTAEILIDSTAERATVRELTIASNTIQATRSEGGANIRIVGPDPERGQHAGMAAITGNVIGNQDVGVHLVACRGVTLTGNFIYSGYRRNLLVESSRNVVVSANSFGHNPDARGHELALGVRLVDSEDCVLGGLVVRDADAGKHTMPGAPEIDRDGLVEIVRCRRVTLSGCQLLEGAPHGLAVEASSEVVVTGCTITEARERQLLRSAIRWRGPGADNVLQGNLLSNGTAGATVIEDTASVQADGNRTVGAG